MALFQRNKERHVAHVAVDGTTASYLYHPDREIWIVKLNGSPRGIAPNREEAQEVALNLVLAVDEGHINRAFEYLSWANEVWPGLGSEELIETVMKHCPGACRQAVVDVLKRGKMEETT